MNETPKLKRKAKKGDIVHIRFESDVQVLAAWLMIQKRGIPMYILVTDYEKHWDNIIGKTSYPRGYDSYIEPCARVQTAFFSRCV